MAYSKIWKAIQDAAIGYQTINQARDNLDALWEAYDVEHGAFQAPQRVFGSAGGIGRIQQGVMVGPKSSIRWDAYGLHDSILIPRAVVLVNVTERPQYSGDFHCWTEHGNDVVSGVVRTSVGKYVLKCDSLTDNSWVEIHALQETTGSTFSNNPTPVARLNQQISTTAMVSIDVTLWDQELSGANGVGEFYLSDYSFYLAVFGE